MEAVCFSLVSDSLVFLKHHLKIEINRAFSGGLCNVISLKDAGMLPGYPLLNRLLR